ncbi:MAG: immunoglobulin-like domain-containing protein [Huintestinicola sp.]|uniref:immunoglobulin-like domain-containing protein n=1 Tax=Huintestinicola sp. TaxID=2981661 RepID=UPI003F0CA5E7
MKKFTAICGALLLTACKAASAPEENVPAHENNIISVSEMTEETVPTKQYVMVSGLLYENTGEINNAPRCGNTDGKFPEIIPENELPRKNGQANFSGVGGWQNGTEPMTIDVLYKDDWYVFAEADTEYERECDFGLSLSAENVTPTGLTLVYTHSGEPPAAELGAGPSYYIEHRTENGWELCETVIDDYGWCLVADLISPDKETRNDINWEWLYGELPEGNYRISKTVIPDTDYWNACTFRAEFEVE